MKKFIISILVIISIIIGNACYWLFSDIQTRCVEKINNNKELSLYEKSSIMSLHLGICSLGYLYCPDAAYANFKMLITNEDSIYLHSKNWLTPKIKSRFNNNQLGKMTWNGNTDYSFNSAEKNGAVLLNWCILDERCINNKICYVAECDYTWKQPSKTTFKITENFSIIVYEQLFYELEKIGILNSYKLICYYEK
jgi:hypothetical protein